MWLQILVQHVHEVWGAAVTNRFEKWHNPKSLFETDKLVGSKA